MKFCPFCGSKVGNDSHKKQESPIESPPAKPEATGIQTPVKDRKKLLIGGIIAAVAMIAIVLISVLGTNVNKDIDPEVISGVEERAISELNNNSMREIEDQLKDLYPSYTWKCMPPNKNSNLKSPKELGTDDGIYKLEVFVDINLYGSSGSIAGYTAARLKADVKLTNKKGAYQISNAVVTVDSSPYMIDEDPIVSAPERQQETGQSSSSGASSSPVEYDFIDALGYCSIWINFEDDDDVIYTGNSPYGLGVQIDYKGYSIIDAIIQDSTEVYYDDDSNCYYIVVTSVDQDGVTADLSLYYNESTGILSVVYDGRYCGDYMRQA